MQISIWEKESFYAAQDIIIVGAGLAGLWVAYEIGSARPAAKITILEAGIIPTGASTRNAGFACFGSPTELLHDAREMGEDEMWRIAALRYKGIQKIKTLFASAAYYAACGGYECLQHGKHNIPAIEHSLHWLNAGLAAITGNKQVFMWANDKLQKFDFNGFDAMIENRFEGGLHSGKLVQALAQKIQAAGVKILYNTAVTAWKETPGGIRIYTKQNTCFKAATMIVCTNAFTKNILPGIDVTPARGQVLVTSPIEGLQLNGTFHFDEGYYYFRNLDNRILLGGARNTAFDEEQTTVLETSNKIQEALEGFLYSHLVQPKQKVAIDYRWSGIMGFTKTKQPVVKQVSENILAVIACNGMGVALTPVVAEEVAKRILL